MIHLYLNGIEINLGTDPNIKYNYDVGEITNPSVIKNKYSRTVEIPSTPANDTFFREIINGGDIFNASRKIDFTLTDDGMVIETGYARLDSYDSNNGKSSYSISLFGGLGNFIYNLSYNDITGNKRQLNDLNFYDGDVELDLDFQINRFSVKDAWNAIDAGTNTGKWSVLNFAPCYNGIPTGDFDARHILIDVPASGTPAYNNSYNAGFTASVGNSQLNMTEFPRTITAGGTNYSVKNGYALASFNSEQDEWETRDHRSYLQRPVINVKKVLEAICDPRNNGGYTVEGLEEAMADCEGEKYNVYYGDSWMTLPLLSDLKGEERSEQLTLSFDGIRNGEVSFEKYYTYTSPAIDGGVGRTYNITVNDLVFKTSDVADDLHMINYAFNSDQNICHNKYSCIVLQAVGFDNQNKIVAASEEMYYMMESPNYDPYPGRPWATGVNFRKSPIVNYADMRDSSMTVKTLVELKERPKLVYGYFSSDSTGDNTLKAFERYSETEPSFTFKLERTTNVTKLGIRIINFYYEETISLSGSLYGNIINNPRLALFKEYPDNPPSPPDLRTYFYYMNSETSFPNSGEIISQDELTHSNSLITKENLLSTPFTPAEFLINYCKIFNLHMTAANDEKKILITSRSQYYTGDIVNIDKRVDLSDEISIKPINFDKRYYYLKYDDSDKSTVQDIYFNKYNEEYGVKKFDTGYDFNIEQENYFESIFTQGVDVQKKTPSARMIQGSYPHQKVVPWFLNQGINYTLWNANSQEQDFTCIPNVTYEEVDIEGFTKYYDLYPKIQFENNGSPIKGAYCLIHSEPDTTTFGVYTLDLLTDDVPDMFNINNKLCWFFSLDDNKAIKLNMADTKVPRFNRYAIGDEIFVSPDEYIDRTWNFGRPRELYAQNVKFNTIPGATISEQIWDKYIADIYDINTRVMECWVDLTGIDPNTALRNFYIYKGKLWVLNKIDGYRIGKKSLTKCTFTRVLNPLNYTNNELKEQ